MDFMVGKHITPKDKEDLYRICKNVGRFTGAMRLFGKYGNDFCEADLMIQNGLIIAATFENLEKGELYLGGDAISQIDRKFIKKGGRLDLYKFSEKIMRNILKENSDSIIASKVSVENIGLKIKPHEPKKIKKGRRQSSGGNGISGVFGGVTSRSRQIDRIEKKEKNWMNGNISGKNLIISAGNLENFREMRSSDLIGKKVNMKEIPKIFENIKTTSPEEQERKRNLLKRLAERRGIIDSEIAERMAKLWGKKDDEKNKGEGIAEKKVVKTSIDKLFYLVKKYHVLKINDRLARKLGVGRTQIESWALILEEHSLVELHYPTIGEPEIREKKVVEEKPE